VINASSPLRSLAARIALSAAALGIGVMLVVSVLGYLSLSRELKARAVDDIEAKRALLQHILSEIPSVAALTTDRHRLDDLLIGHEDLHLAVFDTTGSRVIAAYSSFARDASPLMLDALTAARLVRDSPIREWSTPSGQQLLVTIGTARLANGETPQFALLQDRQADGKLLSRYARALAIALPLALLIAVVGAWLTARSGLRPLRQFVTVASSIGSQSLTGRIDIAGIPSELRELANSFNSMLARLDEGMRRLVEFSGDLAHEMRTPVATLLGRTQVALSKTRDMEALRDTLASNVEELERLTRLIADMLFLAQSEQDKQAHDREVVRLEVEVNLVAEFLTQLAEDRQLEITVAGKASVRANRLLVQRAITNLVSNAIRHARERTAIEVTIEQSETVATLCVVNQGSAIATADLPRIFERFYRVDADRSRHSGGAGLGLAIVRSIMEMHGGEVTVSSTTSGRTTFQLRFPVTQMDVAALPNVGG